MSDEEYETKIVKLLKHAFAADLNAGPHARDVWRRARQMLQQGDHYILVMVDSAVGPQMKRWWQFW